MNDQFTEPEKVEMWATWRKVHSKICRDRMRITDAFPLVKGRRDLQPVDFQQLCVLLGIEPEFDELLIKLRTRIALPPELRERAERAFINKAAQRDIQRRAKAAEYQAGRRSSKAAEFRAALAAVKPVNLITKL